MCGRGGCACSRACLSSDRRVIPDGCSGCVAQNALPKMRCPECRLWDALLGMFRGGCPVGDALCRARRGGFAPH
ncbi:hypothetical protein F7H86_09155 [Novacetimonas hansenii]|uniref:hypothetical protein n=1 Tax=Novacetimonas hansenii TaxID=436 RepID=UPI0009BA0107